MKTRNYSAIAQLLYLVVFLLPPAYAYFVWHWPIGRVLLGALFVAFIGIVGAVTVGVLFAELAMRRRTKEVNVASRELDLTYYPGPIHRELVPEAAWDTPMLEDADVDLRNMLHGKTDTAVVKIFDCYLNIVVNAETPWRGKHRHRNTVFHLEQTVLAIESPRLQLPQFVVTPRPEWGNGSDMTVRVSIGGFAELLGLAPSYQVVRFDEREPFATRYELRSHDPKGARAMFNQRVTSFFLHTPAVNVYGNGNILLLFREDELASVDGMRVLLAEGLKLFKLLQNRLRTVEP